MQSEPVIHTEIPSPIEAKPRWRPRRLSVTWNSSTVDRAGATAVTADELGALQQAFDRYEILDCIDRGGQGVVYRARQKVSSRTVALKLLLDGPLAGDRQRFRFEREIELVARLRHPNIVTLFDSGVTRGRLFYAMEFIDGLPIDDYAVLQDLSPRSIVQLMTPVCRAIHFAHQNGVIHRDLKPAHILVGADGQPRVFDFGLAKDVTDSSSDARFSCTGQVVGTLPYLSPEQAGGHDGKSDVRSDVYALGVILFQLLTELFPYPVDGCPQEQVRQTIIGTEPLPLRKAVSLAGTDRALRSHEVNRDLEAIVAKALRKEKGERYQSAGELADDLDRYLNAEAVTALAGSRWYSARKAIRKHRVAFSVAAFVGSVLIGSGVAVSMSLMEAREKLGLARDAAETTSGMFSFAINRLEKAVRPLPGGIRVRETLIADMVPQWSKLQSLGEIAPALDRMGLDFLEAQADIAAEQGGQRADAAELYRELITQLLRSGGDWDEQTRFLRLSTACRKLASVIDQPEVALGKAIDYAEQALRTEISGESGPIELCKSLVELAAHYTFIGEPICAIEAADRVIQLASSSETVIFKDEWSRLMARGISERGFARRKIGMGEVALIDLQGALRIRENIVVSNPTDVFARNDLIRACYSVATALRDGDKIDEAMRFLERGAELGSELAAMDPTATLWNQNRFRVHHELALIQSERGDTASAWLNCRIAARLVDDPKAEWGSDAERDESRAFVAILEGRLYLIGDAPEDALGRFEWAERLLEGILQLRPDVPRHPQQLASAYHWLGVTYRKLGFADATIPIYERVLAIYSALADADSESTANSLNSIQARINLAEALVRSDRSVHDARAHELIDSAASSLTQLVRADRLVGYEKKRKLVEKAIETVQSELASQPEGRY